MPFLASTSSTRYSIHSSPHLTRTRGNARYEVLTGSELDPIDPAGDMCPVGISAPRRDDRQAGFAYFSLAFVSPKAITDRPKPSGKTRLKRPRDA